MFTSTVLGIALLQSTRHVEFNYDSRQPLESVCIVGEFNEWDRAKFPLSPDSSRMKWRGTFPIEPGAYNYLVCEDNKRWLPDPARKLVRDTNGNPLTRLVVFPIDFESHPGKVGDGHMTISALLHRPEPLDTARLNSSQFYVRLRTRATDVQSAKVLVQGREHGLKVTRSDELYDYWQGEFQCPGPTPEYSFIVQDGDSKLTYPANGDTFSQRLARYPLPSVPAWAKDAIFYQIFPDRFDNGEPTNDPPDVQPWDSLPTSTNRMGGDLKGIEKRLPYLKDLGINAIYLNPVFKSISNHGYDTVDYLCIDPRFGTIDDLKRLVRRCHDMRIRVVLDAIFNHSSPQFFAFQDLVAKGPKSKYAPWYFPLAYPIQVEEGQKSYRTFAGVPTMPKLNTDHPDAADYLIRVGEYWIRECAIDGWRLDVADEVSPSFWRKFRTAIKQLKPDALIVGEVWGDAHTYLQGDQHDGVMNYRWRRLVQEWLLDPTNSNDILLSGLALIRADYPDASHPALFNVLSSHDTERMATRFMNDESAIRMATALQFFLPGIPCVYYGEELGMEGGHDPLCRGTMVWKTTQWNQDRFDWFKGLIRQRTERMSLRRASNHRAIRDANVLILERKFGTEWTRLYINRSGKAREVALPPTASILAGYRVDRLANRFNLQVGGVVLVGNKVPAISRHNAPYLLPGARTWSLTLQDVACLYTGLRFDFRVLTIFVRLTKRATCNRANSIFRLHGGDRRLGVRFAHSRRGIAEAAAD